jgi:hypothetical protein
MAGPTLEDPAVTGGELWVAGTDARGRLRKRAFGDSTTVFIVHPSW